METIEITNDLITEIHSIVFDELKTKRKINKFVAECKKLNDIIIHKELNSKINELIQHYYMTKNIKFNRKSDDFLLSDIEYIIFYYFRQNDYNYNFVK